MSKHSTAANKAKLNSTYNPQPEVIKKSVPSQSQIK